MEHLRYWYVRNSVHYTGSTSDNYMVCESGATEQVLSESQRVESEVLMDTGNTSECRGFVIVGDNLDKNFRPSHQREDRQTKSLHVFHSCVIKNRIDVSSLSDKPAAAVLSVDMFLLSRDDVTKILQQFEVLVSRFVIQVWDCHHYTGFIYYRILVQNREEFKQQAK